LVVHDADHEGRIGGARGRDGEKDGDDDEVQESARMHGRVSQSGAPIFADLALRRQNK
jgi:hypothetical protein